MDEITRSIAESENIRRELDVLRRDTTRKGMIRYNRKLIEALSRQENLYFRLKLMGDPESIETADGMEYVAEQYMGKKQEESMSEFLKDLQAQVQAQLDYLELASEG